MTLVALIFILPSSVNGHKSTARNEQTECDDPGWEHTTERILDFWTLDIVAHQATLEKLGEITSLQDLVSTHATVGKGLREMTYLVSRVGCSMKAYARAESEDSHRELILATIAVPRSEAIWTMHIPNFTWRRHDERHIQDRSAPTSGNGSQATHSEPSSACEELITVGEPREERRPFRDAQRKDLRNHKQILIQEYSKYTLNQIADFLKRYTTPESCGGAADSSWSLGVS